MVARRADAASRDGFRRRSPASTAERCACCLRSRLARSFRMARRRCPIQATPQYRLYHSNAVGPLREPRVGADAGVKCAGGARDGSERWPAEIPDALRVRKTRPCPKARNGRGRETFTAASIRSEPHACRQYRSELSAGRSTCRRNRGAAPVAGHGRRGVSRAHRHPQPQAARLYRRLRRRRTAGRRGRRQGDPRRACGRAVARRADRSQGPDRHRRPRHDRRHRGVA